MARFDLFINPNKAARHLLYLDVQSDFVTLSTRLCIPLFTHDPSKPILRGAQGLIEVDQRKFVMDAPNLLAVPTTLLRRKIGRLSSGAQLIAEACIEFMPRGY